MQGVRAFGTSFHDRRRAAGALRDHEVDIAFARYNPRHPGAEEDLFPHVKKRAPALLYNFNTTFGYLPPDDLARLGLSKKHWAPKPTDYYRFALARPEIDGLLVSTRTPEQVRELVRAVKKGPLTEEETQYLRDLGELANGEASLA
jgi:aryl-alcohol dehydrogenase-like predicted oxidoreductase